jgi:hypothetical protein
MTTIKYLSNIKKFKLENNFILSAFNLAFLGFFFKKRIVPNKHFVVWPDGIFAYRYGCKMKIPGRYLIENLNIDKSIKKIIVLGDCSRKEIFFLKRKYKKEIFHFNLKYAPTFKIKPSIPKIEKDVIYILTLPTPKQEEIAQYISRKYSNFKVVCIGGGLKMAAGLEHECPKVLYKLGLEFIWRLRSDFNRRVKRLFFTLFAYILLINNKKIKIKLKHL